MQEQIIAKLASLETNVSSGFRRLDEKMDRFQADMHDGQIRLNDKINDLDREFGTKIALKKERIDNLAANGEVTKTNTEKRLVDVETWQKVIMARVGLLVGGATILFTLLGPSIRDFMGISNG